MALDQGFRPPEALLGDSPAIHRIGEQLRKAALTDVPVLITGESGTGKELAARLLHDLSARRTRIFLKVNCPAIATQFFDELFGDDPGTLKGTIGSGSRKCEQAYRGTLFLDEIGELDRSLQAKVLQALHDCRISQPGSVTDRQVDIRLVCATSRDLESDVANGGFRSDLYYRINVLRIQMPALRERASDVPILMNHFIRMYSVHFGKRPELLGASSMRMLESYHWPGNIRELENLAKRYVVLGGEDHIASALRWPKEVRQAPETVGITTPFRV